MGYESLEEKLQAVFRCSSLIEEEKQLLLAAYLTPGMTLKTCKTRSNNTEKTLQDLIHKGLVFILENKSDVEVYPIPLALMLEKCVQEFKPECLKPLADTIESIDKWIKYPLMRSRDTKIKVSSENKTVIQWLFDLHTTDWERVFCFGDYESFIETIGFDTESEWIKERINNSRKASVVATQDGEWARYIRDESKAQMRDCLIDPKDFTGLFIMAFPEINTTVMGGKESDVTFIHSATVSNHYGNLVEENLIGV